MQLAEMTYPRFRQIARRESNPAVRACDTAGEPSRSHQPKLGDLAFVDVTGRWHTRSWISATADAMTHPEGTQIKVSRQELSRLVGCSREMAGRVLKVLEGTGLLTRPRQDDGVYACVPSSRQGRADGRRRRAPAPISLRAPKATTADDEED